MTQGPSSTVWTEPKVAELRALYAAGYTYIEIAKALGASEGTISHRLSHLGITRDPALLTLREHNSAKRKHCREKRASALAAQRAEMERRREAVAETELVQPARTSKKPPQRDAVPARQRLLDQIAMFRANGTSDQGIARAMGLKPSLALDYGLRVPSLTYEWKVDQ